MKQIKSTDLKPGDVFTKKIELHGRKAFKVVDIPEGKNYIEIEERDTGMRKRFFTSKVPYVIFLRRD
jgi:hypothetical protein